ncbi:hypothetical protein BDW74DRAFT_188412 [Aspergillus multicolor]|uniref:ABC transporter ATP-binding protein n=1 Tax=Aspergillus multicolor TaxID=41759 RepID=UPI003CCE0D11
MTLLSGSSIGSGLPVDFMSRVSRSSLYFVYIGIARFGCTYLYASLLTFVGHRLVRNIRYQYLRAALGQETGYFDQGVSGSIAMQATSNGKLVHSAISEKLGVFIQALATFTAAFILAFVTHWKLTIIIICVIPAFLVIGGVVGIFDAQIEAKILKAYAQAGTYAENILGGIRAIHAFSLRPRVVYKYSKYLDDAYNLGIKRSPLYGVMFGGEFFVLYAGTGLAFWQGIRMLADGEIPDIGTVFTVLFSVIIAASTITAIAPHAITFTRAASAASELFTLIDRESEINPFEHRGDRPTTTTGTLEINHVQFSYPTRPNVRVLDDFSLRIPAGKVTALVGTSGSGKSTIVGLLERWYDPQSGTIRLDGANIEQLNLKWLRTNIRLVQQEPVLFNGSVFDNIANGLVGTPWESASYEIRKQRVENAANIAYAHGFIMNLPNGYLSLATSALDPHAEGIVQQALDCASQNRTTIVIAHKLATIRNADNIVVMSKGRIVEQGRHEELIARGGTYGNLVRAQDLSTVQAPEEAEPGMYEVSREESETALPVTRDRIATAQQLGELQKREDYSLAPKAGLLRNITKLIIATPELIYWYLLTFASCVIGAAVYPGQALLLASVMDIFSSDNMVDRGNFIALMYLTNRTQSLSRNLRQDILEFILKQDLRFFDRPENGIGALTERLDAYPQAIFELMGFNISLVVMSMINVLACSILSLVTSWKLGVMGVFVGLPPMLLAGYVRIRLETKMDGDMGKRFSQSASIASEAVLSIRTISSLAMEEVTLQKYTYELDSALRSSTLSLFSMMVWFALTQSIEYFILASGFWWGSKLISEGNINFYQFIVSFMGVYFSGQAAGQLFSFSSSFTKANAAPLIQETDDNKDKHPPKDLQSIGFSNVHFSYPLAPDTHVLKGISLKIQKGQFVAFVGASGCGKSTMVSLLERFYDPTQGTIALNYTAVPSLNPLAYRKQIALVQQEPTLFPGTILENILHGLDMPPDNVNTPSTQRVEAACRAANVWDFITSLPEGLHTPCGTGGSKLSGGQRQRIAIARALIREPSIILLDEATSALDTESERVVQAALMDAAKDGDKTIIAVAHRLSTVREADCIFVFMGGRVVEMGRHDELVRQGGVYSGMCEAQRLDLG